MNIDPIRKPIGYLRLTDLTRSTGPHGDVISLTFTHTNEPRLKAIACMPIEDCNPNTPEEVFLRFNVDYPDAQEHLEHLIKFIQRLV